MSVVGVPSGSEYEGTRVLVTGGTKGIGAAVASRFVSRGARVVVAAREAADDEPGSDATFVKADLSRAEDVKRLARQTLEILGGIDVVVSNAGSPTQSPDGFRGLDDAAWTHDLDLNLMAAVRLDRELLPAMIDQRSGVVLHVSSQAARMPQRNALAYAAAKAALLAYGKGLAADVAPYGIRVNAVLPGVVAGSALRRALQAAAGPDEIESSLDELMRRRAEEWKIPLGRIGTVDDAAALIDFLASPQASYLTGGQFPVDGGLVPTW